MSDFSEFTAGPEGSGFVRGRVGAQGRRSRQRGVSLIEVLVTVLILGVGLLGVAALQIKSMRLNQDAYLRSQATVLASSLVDSMRLRRTTLAAGYTAAAPSTGNCNPADASVAAEVLCWHRELAARLPGGTGSVVQDTTNLSQFTVTVSWLDRDASEAAGSNVLRDQAWQVELE